MTKREKVELLLDHWTDFFEPASSVGLAGSTEAGGGTPLLCGMSRHPSVVELHRAVSVCRDRWPNHYRHLAGFYTAPWRNVERVTRRKNHRGRMIDDLLRVRERVVPSWVALRMVRLAVDGVAFEFRGEVFIPDELLSEIAA